MTIAGNSSMLDGPEGTLDDIIDLDVLVDDKFKIRDLVSSTGGPFCYIYV